MSDGLEGFLNEDTEAVTEEVTEVETEVEAAGEEVAETETEAEVVAEEVVEEEGSPPEPEKTEKSGEVPIAALLDEREKRQSMQRELEELRSQTSKSEVKPLPDVFEDQDAFVSGLQAQLNQQVFTSRVEMSQDMMRTLHEDYDAVEEKFLAMTKENPELEQKLIQAAVPARFAYETVKKAERLEAMDNVDEWESKKTAELEIKIRKEIEEKMTAELAGKAEKAASISPSLTNTRAEGGNAKIIVIEDPLETTFNH